LRATRKVEKNPLSHRRLSGVLLRWCSCKNGAERQQILAFAREQIAAQKREAGAAAPDSLTPLAPPRSATRRAAEV
jgi:hypothetical protein